MKKESDVLGYSMVGSIGSIAQELTLKHPYKLDDWDIYASHCALSDRSFYPSDELLAQFNDLKGTEDEIKMCLFLINSMTIG